MRTLPWEAQLLLPRDTLSLGYRKGCRKMGDFLTSTIDTKGMNSCHAAYGGDNDS